jgi:hypothetical protein
MRDWILEKLRLGLAWEHVAVFMRRSSLCVVVHLETCQNILYVSVMSFCIFCNNSSLLRWLALKVSGQRHTIYR